MCFVYREKASVIFMKYRNKQQVIALQKFELNVLKERTRADMVESRASLLKFVATLRAIVIQPLLLNLAILFILVIFFN